MLKGHNNVFPEPFPFRLRELCTSFLCFSLTLLSYAGLWRILPDGNYTWESRALVL